MLIGPVFTREVVTTPRRPKFYFYRAVYVAGLLVLMCTAWLVLAGTQQIRNQGDMARFGAILFQVLAPLQLALVVFFSALQSASAVALEKDRRTLILLLMTRLTNSELVLGRLLASLLNVLVIVAAALPLFMMATLFGGVSYAQVARVFAVTLVTALVAGSLGSTLALWREKTFQALALTTLALVVWFGVWEPLAAGAMGPEPAGISAATWGAALSPMRAVLAAARPVMNAPVAGDASALAAWTQNPVDWFLVGSLGIFGLLNLIAILRVRVWNPSREVRATAPAEEEQAASIWGAEHDLASGPTQQELAERERAGHVDARLRSGKVAAGRRRQVWANPILWREMCTWAYGRKMIAIRVGYLLLVAASAAGLWWTVSSGAALARGSDSGAVVPAAAKPLAPLLVVSLAIINALAVTSITSERDGRTLDLLLASDIDPREFLIGKIGGIFWVTKEMVLLPMMLCVYLWASGGMGLENLLFTIGGLLVMNAFVAMLGVHAGMAYASSRTAISVSLGTVFFLLLGVVTCILMMISFSGSFQVQLTPFLAFMVGGGVGLYVALGARNPSTAIFLASAVLPFATFYAIVSFLLEKPGFVFLVTAAAYSFTVAAMLIPALYEFDVAMGRTTGGEDA